MNKLGKIDIRGLQEKARKSEDNEAFTVLEKTGICRIGVGARVETPAEPTFFVEVLVSLCSGYEPVDLDLLDRKLSLLRRLKQRGYLLNCEQDGCVSCELAVQSKSMIAEFRTTRSTVEECMKTRNRQ